MKRSISAVLAAIMVCAAMFTGVFAADKKITVTMRVEGMYENKFYKENAEVTVSGDKLTAADALKQLIGKKNYVETAGQYGTYFSEIYGETEYSATSTSGWNYVVDGKAPPVSAAAYELKGGENVVFYFGDMNTLVPQVQAVRSATGAGLKVTAMSWDANWAPVQIAVEGAEITWDGVLVGKTDEKGIIALPNEKALAGEHKLGIKKDGESVMFMGSARNMPMVLRMAENNKFTAPQQYLFTDVAQNNWAAKYIYALTEKGTVNGMGDGTFGIGADVTGYQLVKMLGNPMNTETAEPVTRQQAAVLIYNFCHENLKELPIYEFADDSKITEKKAVYALKNAGIFSGKSGNNFDPEGMLRRDECAKLVYLTLECMDKK